MTAVAEGHRRRVATAAIAIATTACACSGTSPTPGVTHLPTGTSVVLITLDTLRADHLSRNGHPRETTPYLDRLAGEGVYCSRSYAQSSWTLPSMLSMFSSLEPAVFGVTQGLVPIPRRGMSARPELDEREFLAEYFSDHYSTLTEVLAEHGYETAGFSTNGHLRIEQGFAQGFRTFDQESCMWGTAACVLERAGDWLDGHVAVKRPRPFFLWIHVFDPHFDESPGGPFESPIYAPPAGYEGLFPAAVELSPEERTRRDYDRKIRYADDQIGAFVESLRARGLLDRAVLVVAADHGEEFNERGLWGHSRSLYDTLVHVPLMFRFPGGEPRGVFAEPVRNIDVAPTLLDALGLPARGEMRGVSLLSAFRGGPFRAPKSYGETRRFDSDLRFLVDPERGRKLVLDLRTGRRELYALEDAAEVEDLALEEPDVAQALEQELLAAIAEMEELAVPVRRRSALSAEEVDHLRALGYLN